MTEKEIKENICVYESTNDYDIFDITEYNYLKTLSLIELLKLFPHWRKE